LVRQFIVLVVDSSFSQKVTFEFEAKLVCLKDVRMKNQRE